MPGRSCALKAILILLVLQVPVNGEDQLCLNETCYFLETYQFANMTSQHSETESWASKDASGTSSSPPKLTSNKSVLAWIAEVQAWCLYTAIEIARQAAMICAIGLEPNSEKREQAMAWLRTNLPNGVAVRDYSPRSWMSRRSQESRCSLTT